MNLPTEQIIKEFDHALVVYTCEHGEVADRVMPRLHAHAVCQYGYRRDLIVERRPTYGDPTRASWHYYAHHQLGRHTDRTINESLATRFILKFLELCDDQPASLFNPADEHRPRHEGFVKLMETLIYGHGLAMKLLD
jgi:hypothetical protein